MLHLLSKMVAAEPLYDPTTTESGRIIIPAIAQERCDQGIVKYVGPDVQLVKPGDHVLFSGYTGSLVEIQFEGRFIIMPERFITCIILDDTLDVAGLFFKDRDGVFHAATYEMVTELCARSLERVNTVKPSKHAYKIDSRPSAEEYNEPED